jgi:hypothetical protein
MLLLQDGEVPPQLASLRTHVKTMLVQTLAKIVAQVLAFAGDFCEQTSTHSAVGGLLSLKVGILRS